MSINGTNSAYETTYGKRASQVEKSDMVKANFWLNVGYSVEVKDAEGTMVSKFVSLPGGGTPLDTTKPLDVKGGDEFASFRTAQNDLLAQLLESAKTLKPGQDRIFGDAGGLQFQLRRVQDARPVIQPDANMFSRKLAFA
jgi:hypothetical protein